MIQGWDFSSVRPQIEGGPGRADLPFWDGRFCQILAPRFARYENVARM